MYNEVPPLAILALNLTLWQLSILPVFSWVLLPPAGHQISHPCKQEPSERRNKSASSVNWGEVGNRLRYHCKLVQ
ncbi:hypothetical protein BT96DRAFT_681917 [Gymnopus androsaceus JB14]|uniref:Uncharacterized protein n=1 Tax=Gymnopus androsaceus JB14 TaxID=1447944 RepID=A0A6A4GFJ0_9AGAR|nr:hypothetical protein BT96DRAFT_681917 [Gymnopus androsaceus JB14]